ncbi:hypothetical protein QBC44DRAFT_384251 [Cladorrhinum sp. PSN332]|nr:hypothetical protein QBC44DRAFT_384251 [Cladorrhinum sp. PSN332]
MTRAGRVPSILCLVAWALALALLLIVPLFSMHAYPNSMSGLQFAAIYAGNTTVKVGEDVMVGLPDVYDSDRHKQIFVIYLVNYCSGFLKPGSNDEYVMDFCSEDRKEIWDNFGVWQQWGVNLQDTNGGQNFEWLQNGPKWLRIAYLVANSATGLALILSLVRLHRLKWARWLIIIVSTLAAAAALTVAIATQVTYGILVSKANDDGIPITVKQGMVVYLINWVAAGAAMAALILRTVYMRKTGLGGEAGSRRSNGRGMGSAVVYGTPKYVEVKDPDVAAHALISGQNTRYEPYSSRAEPPHS